MAKEIISCRVLPTRGAFDLYWKHKNSHLGTEHKGFYRASDTFATLSQHLNIAQVIVSGKGYLCEAYNTDITKLQETLTLMTKEHLGNAFSSEVRKRLSNSFQSALSCLDTKKDRDIFMGIFAHLTSANTVMRLQNLQNRGAIVRQAVRTDSLFRNYETMRTSVLSVRSDMTNKQQQEFERKKLKKLSAKYFKSICDGRGRRLKCEEFPELPFLLEYAFGQQDVLERGGGGLQAHSKLYENTLYKAMDNKTIMREARDVILALADENFDVSLSCLYTYTMNYKKGTNQAKRHHIGRNVNANISLHKAPSTGDFKHPVNAHWSTSHVNFICDEANQYKSSCMIDSKDAKCIINGELPPVLKPGKTWKSIEYPDHTFDQSRNNAVTPITHLFLQSNVLPFNTPALNSANLNVPGTQTEVKVTRTGKAVTLINLSLYEPETVLRVFNEIFYLMSIPELDVFFRNPETLQVKEVFIFVVDNGPSEAPASNIVQMLLARLVKFLNLDKAVQRSFAEYLSKRNFVERCHAAENKALERHEPFSSKQINPSAVPGTEAHKENMEKMATDVRAAIDGTMFNKEPIHCFRGVGDRLVFDDDEGLKYFSSLCKDRKESCDLHYSAVKNGIYGYLVQNWGVEENFTGSYADDYRSLESDASKSKYSVSVYREDDQWRGKMQEKFEREPIPDLLRFEHTQAMHYLPYEVRRDLPVGEWDGISQLFLPSDILDLSQKVFYPKPSQDMLSAIAFLAWIPLRQVEEFFTCASKDAELLAEEDNSKEFWSKHSLFVENTREELVAICNSKKLLETGKKHELVERIAKATEGGNSWMGSCNIYSGNLAEVPSSVAQLNRQPVRFLRAVLRFHGIVHWARMNLLFESDC